MELAPVHQFVQGLKEDEFFAEGGSNSGQVSHKGDLAGGASNCPAKSTAVWRPAMPGLRRQKVRACSDAEHPDRALALARP